LNGFDAGVPSAARRYGYWLGGKDNLAVDRVSGDVVAKVFPAIRIAAAENRAFMRRAVGYLACERGVRQFLDVGAGMPDEPNTHEVAQAVDPAARVVYVDHDELVMAHARALMAGDGPDWVGHVEADLRCPEDILADVWHTLDRTRPVGLLLGAVLHFIADSDDPYAAVARLVAAMPAGSYLVASHATRDLLPAAVADALDEAIVESGIDFWLRDRAEFERFLAGLDLVAPGVCCVSEWRAEREARPRPDVADVSTYGAVARIPVITIRSI
jgi:S-adenosyl methyltransferase